MTVWATASSLVARLLRIGASQSQTTRRPPRRRGACPVCGGDFAITSKGVYKHRCQPPTATTEVQS